MRKILLFIWCIFSLLGLLVGLNEADYYGDFRVATFFGHWIGMSVPLIIHLLYIMIFD